MNPNKPQNRLKKLAYRSISLCAVLPQTKVCANVEDQLLRFAFSTAANYGVTHKGQSSKAFISKQSIALEEVGEKLFWFNCINHLKLMKPYKLKNSLKETDERIRILATLRKATQVKILNNHS